jgi:hypothetical protein
MISETVTSTGTPAITSDHWHVVHSKFTRKGKKSPPFERIIVSEHDSRTGCCAAARALRASLAKESKVPLAQRDEVFVRKPNFKSLKAARHRTQKKTK